MSADRGWRGCQDPWRPSERKAKNLASSPHRIITTGCNVIDGGLDVVVEGEGTTLLYEVRPTTVLGFGKGEFSQTRWRF